MRDGGTLHHLWTTGTVEAPLGGVETTEQKDQREQRQKRLDKLKEDYGAYIRMTRGTEDRAREGCPAGSGPGGGWVLCQAHLHPAPTQYAEVTAGIQGVLENLRSNQPPLTVAEPPPRGRDVIPGKD